VYEPGVHSGQVEQPSPDPVILTAPPVTTIADCVNTIKFESRFKTLEYEVAAIPVSEALEECALTAQSLWAGAPS
jgi:hypothetical protein